MSGISHRPTGLSLLKGFKKKSFEDFQEITAYGGLDLMILVVHIY